MLSIGIDVSKGKSTVCGMKPGGEIVYTPFEIQHTREGMSDLVSLLRSSGEEVRAVLESTGSYHCPVVAALLENGIFISVVNSLRMKRFCSQSIRKVKTDRIDAKVACSRKEASCIIGSLLVELAPVCEKCGGLPDGVLNLQTEAGLSLTGDADVLITGHSIISGKPVRIKLTDYGFEYYGDHAELARVREKRCVYHGRAVSPTKEN